MSDAHGTRVGNCAPRRMRLQYGIESPVAAAMAVILTLASPGAIVAR